MTMVIAQPSIEEYRRQVRQRWPAIPAGQLGSLTQDRRQLSDHIQRAYGVSIVEAEHQIDGWHAQLVSSPAQSSSHADSDAAGRTPGVPGGYLDEEQAPEREGIRGT